MERIPIRKILLATDFSEGSRKAAEVAIELSRRLDAEVTLLHVYALPVYMFPDGTSIIPEAGQVAKVVDAVNDRLNAQARQLTGSGVRVTTRAVEGNPSEEIVRVAREGDYGLVALGTHGRTGWKHLLMGSVAERVVRTCPVPALTVRMDPEAPSHLSPPVI